MDDPDTPGASDGLLQALCEALSGDGLDYDYTYVAASPGKDGGKPSANIKQALLYQTNLFETVTHSSLFDASCTDGVNPCRIDPMHEAFIDSRKPMVVQLRHMDGLMYTFIVVHFKSLRHGGLAWGSLQPPAVGSATLRRMQVSVVNAYAMKQRKVVVLGDFNDQPFHDALSRMQLRDAHANVPETEQYTYVFNGQSQKIDYIFTKGIRTKAAGIVHLNSAVTEKEQHSDHDIVYVDVG